MAIYTDPDLPKKVERLNRDLNAQFFVRERYPNAYAEHSGFWFVYSDPDLPHEQSFLGSAVTKRGAWRNALRNISSPPKRGGVNRRGGDALE